MKALRVLSAFLLIAGLGGAWGYLMVNLIDDAAVSMLATIVGGLVIGLSLSPLLTAAMDSDD